MGGTIIYVAIYPVDLYKFKQLRRNFVVFRLDGGMFWVADMRVAKSDEHGSQVIA